MSEQRKARENWGFIPLEDATLSDRLIKEAIRNDAPITICTKDQSIEFKSVITAVQETDEKFRLICVRVPEDMKAAEFTSTVSQKSSQECYLSVALPNVTLFCKTTYEGHVSEKIFRFAHPQKIFKLQRRKNMRWEIRMGYAMKMVHDDPNDAANKIERKVMDFSSGGISFVLPIEEAPYYYRGMEIKGIAFKIKTTTIHATAEIRHISTLPATSPHKGGLKVGAMFKMIHPDDVQALQDHIMAEMVKFNSRLI